jgi:fructosamine-3-kinase
VRPVLDRCLDDGAVDAALAGRVAALLDRIEDLVVEPSDPRLVHGDVWTANLLTDGRRVRAFLDPACYYGHPEVELAYADWTDTFGDPFFDRYDDIRGIDPDFFDRRRFVYRVYPLLEHLLLFGDPYGDELAATLDRIE